jgi:hypothetical protein
MESGMRATEEEKSVLVQCLLLLHAPQVQSKKARQPLGLSKPSAVG